jgi:TfoX/Sxy family transcriptional regulator of competence genes
MEPTAEKQTEQIGFRVTPTWYKRGEAAAKADKRKLMDYARQAYEAAIERFEAERK